MLDYKDQMAKYQDDLREYERKRKGLDEVNTLITQSIAPRFLYTI